ncbi:MAG TPA: hypothetical protein VGY32_03505, partial [Solirubrobacteraceae bacterium]|nr:hypothetical protein [Solirubrobacteraceae bacterium]
MKKNTTSVNATFGSAPPIDPIPWKMAVTPPHQLWWPTSATIAPTTARKIAMNATRRYSRRQNQVRRRATTSSSATSRSTPYMLGQGSALRASTSIRPRNAMMV